MSPGEAELQGGCSKARQHARCADLGLPAEVGTFRHCVPGKSRSCFIEKESGDGVIEKKCTDLERNTPQTQSGPSQKARGRALKYGLVSFYRLRNFIG